MKQKLLIAQGELREAYNMAKSNRNERGLVNRLRDAIAATNDSILTLETLEAGKHYAN